MRIISGAQTGADRAALEWAKDNGYGTGGWMPRGFRSEDGPHPEFAPLYEIQEHESRGYPPRTKKNVYESDGTLIFGRHGSPGCRLTTRYCMELGKPLFIVGWPGELHRGAIDDVRAWLHQNAISTLNVAGNREETNPGIGEALKMFLSMTLKEVSNEDSRP